MRSIHSCIYTLTHYSEYSEWYSEYSECYSEYSEWYSEYSLWYSEYSEWYGEYSAGLGMEEAAVSCFCVRPPVPPQNQGRKYGRVG
jgi:hypothetical protein